MIIEKNIKCKDLKYIFSKNAMNKIYLKTKREVYTSVFSGMDNHVSSQSLFTNHRDQLLTLIITSDVHLGLKSIGKQQKQSCIGIRKKPNTPQILTFSVVFLIVSTIHTMQNHRSGNHWFMTNSVIVGHLQMDEIQILHFT